MKWIVGSEFKNGAITKANFRRRLSSSSLYSSSWGKTVSGGPSSSSSCLFWTANLLSKCRGPTTRRGCSATPYSTDCPIRLRWHRHLIHSHTHNVLLLHVRYNQGPLFNSSINFIIQALIIAIKNSYLYSINRRAPNRECWNTWKLVETRRNCIWIDPTLISSRDTWIKPVD